MALSFTLALLLAAAAAPEPVRTLNSLLERAPAALASAPASSSAPLSFPSALARTQNYIDALNRSLGSWDKSKGISAALDTQDDYRRLYDAVAALRTSAGTASDQEVQPEPLTRLIHSIAQLISTLNSKASDFHVEGLTRISSRDVSDLEGPTTDTMAALIRILARDCSKLNQLRGPAAELTNAFAAAERTYDLPAHQFPAVPACNARAINLAGHATPQPTLLSSAIDAPVSTGLESSSSLRSGFDTADPYTHPFITQHGPGPLLSRRPSTLHASAPPSPSLVSHSEITGAPGPVVTSSVGHKNGSQPSLLNHTGPRFNLSRAEHLDNLGAPGMANTASKAGASLLLAGLLLL